MFTRFIHDRSLSLYVMLIALMLVGSSAISKILLLKFKKFTDEIDKYIL